MLVDVLLNGLEQVEHNPAAGSILDGFVGGMGDHHVVRSKVVVLIVPQLEPTCPLLLQVGHCLSVFNIVQLTLKELFVPAGPYTTAPLLAVVLHAEERPYRPVRPSNDAT
jgi:hypothetical protein